MVVTIIDVQTGDTTTFAQHTRIDLEWIAGRPATCARITPAAPIRTAKLIVDEYALPCLAVFCCNAWTAAATPAPLVGEALALRSRWVTGVVVRETAVTRRLLASEFAALRGYG